MKNIILLCSVKAAVLTLLLAFTTSCAPGQAHTRDTQPRDYDREKKEFYEEEFTFDNIGDSSPSVRSTDISSSNNQGSRQTAGTAFSSSPERENFLETGMASWYGREFQGKATASGEEFNMYDMTAAHKTLPFGTILEVKNLENGKSVKVRINDRGPYRGNRIIDLSYNAARNLDILQQEEARVGIKKIETLDKASDRSDSGFAGSPRAQSVAGPVSSFEYEIPSGRSNTDLFERPHSFQKSGYTVQAGAFYSSRNAHNQKDRIQGITNRRVQVVEEGDFFKVKVEGLSSRSEAESFARTLADRNIPSFIIEP